MYLNLRIFQKKNNKFCFPFFLFLNSFHLTYQTHTHTHTHFIDELHIGITNENSNYYCSWPKMTKFNQLTLIDNIKLCERVKENCSQINKWIRQEVKTETISTKQSVYEFNPFRKFFAICYNWMCAQNSEREKKNIPSSYLLAKSRLKWFKPRKRLMNGTTKPKNTYPCMRQIHWFLWYKYRLFIFNCVTKIDIVYSAYIHFVNVHFIHSSLIWRRQLSLSSPQSPLKFHHQMN